ncbi:cell division protein ZipA [Aestuariirhabdus litorea]|uniref:Cell division protein ZipA n=1 Tax=Aestuariirhabdus litorea TaxID=2528527 RepID=A0A3P3VR20_9GAMM|nr:cell division protein ZipA [Aestuariirhabdus litorea]RRJ84418.1 cell division protein ZipA [Aestuariirhabdus litorea]RWW97642.1 cell division protein ZipA [Endozoicomonadaceae bacterium GTF-13]
MDMGVREWLVVVAVLLIVGILADGYRRMRAARQRSQELDFSFKGRSEEFNDELPNGGARVILRSQAADADAGQPEEDDEQDPLFMPPPRNTSRPVIPPAEDQDLESGEAFGSALDEALAFDADPEPFSADVGSDTPAQEEPLFDPAPEPISATPREAASRPAQPPKTKDAQAEKPAAPARPVKAAPEEAEMPFAQVPLNLDEPVPVLMEVDGKSPDAVSPRASERKRKPRVEPRPSQDESPRESEKRPAAEEIIVINVVSRPGQVFSGEALLQQLLAQGLKYGEMSIFHRHEQFNGQGPVQFSLANGVEPGSFDLDHMDQLQTPLVTLFMGLPGPREPLKAFEMMATAAQTLARELGGELKDESRSVMTQQTLAHCKQRITDFERRQLTRSRH